MTLHPDQLDAIADRCAGISAAAVRLEMLRHDAASLEGEMWRAAGEIRAAVFRATPGPARWRKGVACRRRRSRWRAE